MTPLPTAAPAAPETATVIKGQRIVRIRNAYPDIGPLRLHMFVVTDLHDRKRIGIRHLSREAAARWIAAQGWRYIGPQEQLP